MASKVNTPVTTAPRTSGRLPDGWRMVRFGDVVRDVNEAERNPLEAGLERYVGLEHIEPENLRLTQWGDLTEGEISFKKRFRKGQVLFGKRRAYQRKVAVAEFDGICSSDILTFEPKDDALIPELLPFIVQSDGFFQHALGTSSGSLSPRTRWSQLQDYAFPLPSKDEQNRIAEILCTSEDVIEAYRDAYRRQTAFRYTLAQSLWRRGIGHTSFERTPIGNLPSEWRVAPLGEFVTAYAYGPRFPADEYAPTGNVQTIRTTDFDRLGGLHLRDAPFATLHDDVIQKHQLKPGDFLLSRSGMYSGLTATFPDIVGCFIAGAFLVRYQLTPDLLSEYLVHLCYSDFGTLFVMPLARGTYQLNISGSAMLKVLIPVPSVDEQRQIVRMLDLAQKAIRSLEDHIRRNVELQRATFDALLLHCESLVTRGDHVQ